MISYNYLPDRELTPQDEKEYECPQCGAPLDYNEDYCSTICFEASLI
jgi:hypothetical protein